MNSAMRSPEINMPTAIDAPKTTYWEAFESPSTFNIWLSSVTKNAASHVEDGLARPPESAAPPGKAHPLLNLL